MLKGTERVERVTPRDDGVAVESIVTARLSIGRAADLSRRRQFVKFAHKGAQRAEPLRQQQRHILKCAALAADVQLLQRNDISVKAR